MPKERGASNRAKTWGDYLEPRSDPDRKLLALGLDRFAENCIGPPPLPPVVRKSPLCQVDNHGAKLDGYADGDRFNSNSFLKASSSPMFDGHP